MTTHERTETAGIADTVYRHYLRRSGIRGLWSCLCGEFGPDTDVAHAIHVAAALEPLIAARVDAARREALGRGDVVSEHAVESAPHRIVAIRDLAHGASRYTCACSQTIDAHPDVFPEAFEFHVAGEGTGQ